jgi:hypothetical protein
MRIGQRLFLAVVPAVVGVLAMAGLAWWGQRGRQVPEGLLVLGIVAAVASLVLVWRNARYVARRIDALSARARPAEAATGRTDELDAIERALGEARGRGDQREAAEARLREYAALMADALAAAGRGLDEVRLPLHILLESPFGELNENQEEMLGAARAAADAADERLRVVARIAALDAGQVQPRTETILFRDLLAPVLAAAEERFRAAGATLQADLPPALPRVRADAGFAREALLIVLERAAGRATAGTTARLDAEADAGRVRIRLSAESSPPGERFPLAERLLRVQGAELGRMEDGSLTVRFPAASGASAVETVLIEGAMDHASPVIHRT